VQLEIRPSWVGEGFAGPAEVVGRCVVVAGTVDVDGLVLGVPGMPTQ